MARAGKTYDLSGSGHAAQQNSTGIADVKTFPNPGNAVAAFVSVKTGAARVSLTGQTPTASVGIVIPAGALPLWVPVEGDILAAGDGAASDINVLWLF